MRTANKLGRTVIVLMLLAPLAAAQLPNPRLPSDVRQKLGAAVAPRNKMAEQATTATATPQPGTKTAQATTKAQPASQPQVAAKPMQPAAKTSQVVAKPAVKPPQLASPMRPKAVVAKKPSAVVAKPEPKPAEAAAPELASSPKKVVVERGTRDPFVSIIRTRSTGDPNCTTGKKCLQIDQIVLRGVVRGPNGMLAVVENRERKSYFLRENDPVYNGQVVRITGDSITFREKTWDKLGHEKLRDVIKRVPGSKPA